MQWFQFSHTFVHRNERGSPKTMQAPILALLGFLVIAPCSGQQANIGIIQPRPSGLSLDIVDVQVDPGDVWADGANNAARDCLTNPAYPDKAVCKKLLDTELKWGSTPDGRFVAGERRPMFAIFQLKNTTNATTYSGRVKGVWQNHDNSIGVNAAPAERDYPASTEWSFTSLGPTATQWGVIAWKSGITNAGRGDVRLTLNATSPLGIPSHTTAFGKSLSALFTYGVTDVDIVQKRTKTFNFGLEQVHASEGWVSGASFKTTADPQVCHQQYSDSILGNFLNGFMPSVLGNPPGDGCYIQVQEGGQIVATGSGDILDTHDEGKWFHIPNRGARFYFSPDRQDQKYYVYSILFNRASQNDNAFWSTGIIEALSLLAGGYSANAGVPDSYFASTLNPGDIVKEIVVGGIVEFIFSLFEQNCDGVTSFALSGFTPEHMQTLINSASNFGEPDYQDFEETQTAKAPGPNVFANCQDSTYIVRRRVSRRTDARVSTIDPPVAQIKPGASTKFHASIGFFDSAKVSWKAFDRSDKEVGTWKLDADTHWATFTPPPTAYPSPSSESVRNGGFESGNFTNWITSGQTGIQSDFIHSGKKAARVGGNTKNTSVVSTTAGGGSIPAGQSQLSFWIYPHCVNTAGNGILVTLYDGKGHQLAYPYNSSDLGCGVDNDAWKQISLDLTPWAGTQVVVEFKNLHGAGLNSSFFYLDDVSVFTQAGAVAPGEVVFRIAAAGDSNLFLPYAKACVGNFQVPSMCGGCEGCIASAYAVAVPGTSILLRGPNNTSADSGRGYELYQFPIRKQPGEVLEILPRTWVRNEVTSSDTTYLNN
jgi:hypothetical protein